MELRPDPLYYLERFLLEAWPLKLLAAFLGWAYGPWQDGYGVLLALVALDTLTGVWASRVEGRSIRSAILRVRTLTKLGFYAAALMTASLSDRALGGAGLLPAALAVAVVSEALSVVENLVRVYPDSPLGGVLRGLLEARAGGKHDRKEP